VEYELPSGDISSSAVRGHTLVHTGVLRAKVWNFQNPAEVVDFYLAREWVSISSSPGDCRHGAAKGHTQKGHAGHMLPTRTDHKELSQPVSAVAEDVCAIHKLDDAM